MHRVGDLLYHPEAGLGWIEDIRQTKWADYLLYTAEWADFTPRTARNYTYFQHNDIEIFKRNVDHVINGRRLEDW